MAAGKKSRTTRIAHCGTHFILPIPGKGVSEWHYGWVPVAGPFAGACLAAPIMIAVELLYKSGM